jgi:hypothetical protein
MKWKTGCPFKGDPVLYYCMHRLLLQKCWGFECSAAHFMRTLASHKHLETTQEYCFHGEVQLFWWPRLLTDLHTFQRSTPSRTRRTIWLITRDGQNLHSLILRISDHYHHSSCWGAWPSIPLSLCLDYAWITMDGLRSPMARRMPNRVSWQWLTALEELFTSISKLEPALTYVRCS